MAPRQNKGSSTLAQLISSTVLGFLPRPRQNSIDTNSHTLNGAVKQDRPARPPCVQQLAPVAQMSTYSSPSVPDHEVAADVLTAMSKRAIPPKKKTATIPPAKASAQASFNQPQKRKDRIRMLDLPDNIRMKIYTFALVEDDPIALLMHPPFLKEPALLRTCRQVRNEALSMFYSDNAFNSLFHHDLRRWLQKLSPMKLKLLQCVQLTTPMPAGFVVPSLRELTERSTDGLDEDAVSVPMQVQGEIGWLTWVTFAESEQYHGVDGAWNVIGPIRRRKGLKRKREE